LFGEERRMTRNMHIVNRKLTRASFSRKAIQGMNSTQLLSQLRQVESNLTKLTIDTKFVERDQPFSVFLTKGLLEVSDDDNNNYYEFCPGSLYPPKEVLRKVHIDGSNQKQTLKIIEKAISFLRRKFDRFKPDNRENDYTTMGKTMKIDKKQFGIQKKEGKFILWKHGRGSIWKIVGKYCPTRNLITTRWTTRFKKKRKELSCLVNLIKILETINEWQFKGDAIFNIINENNFNEMFVWKEFWKRNGFKKKQLRSFLMGRELILRSNGQAVEDSFGNEVIKVKDVFNACFRGSLEFEYLKKFRFKFEGKNCDANNQLDMFEEFIEMKGARKKKKRRRYSLEKSIEMKGNVKSDNDEITNLDILLHNDFELKRTQLERNISDLTERRSELMETKIDVLCRGQEKSFCQS
jgi:hypothetical protein